MKQESHSQYDLEGIQVSPEYRFRKRGDGGVDIAFRIHFLARLTPNEMRRITEMLLAIPDQFTDAGFQALTKVEFLEPDTCDYRYWCREENSEQLARMYELWDKLNKHVHLINNVDGVHYPWIGQTATQAH